MTDNNLEDFPNELLIKIIKETDHEHNDDIKKTIETKTKIRSLNKRFENIADVSFKDTIRKKIIQYYKKMFFILRPDSKYRNNLFEFASYRHFTNVESLSVFAYRNALQLLQLNSNNKMRHTIWQIGILKDKDDKYESVILYKVKDNKYCWVRIYFYEFVVDMEEEIDSTLMKKYISKNAYEDFQTLKKNNPKVPEKNYFHKIDYGCVQMGDFVYGIDPSLMYQLEDIDFNHLRNNLVDKSLQPFWAIPLSIKNIIGSTNDINILDIEIFYLTRSSKTIESTSIEDEQKKHKISDPMTIQKLPLIDFIAQSIVNNELLNSIKNKTLNAIDQFYMKYNQKYFGSVQPYNSNIFFNMKAYEEYTSIFTSKTDETYTAIIASDTFKYVGHNFMKIYYNNEKKNHILMGAISILVDDEMIRYLFGSKCYVNIKIVDDISTHISTEGKIFSNLSKPKPELKKNFLFLQSLYTSNTHLALNNIENTNIMTNMTVDDWYTNVYMKKLNHIVFKQYKHKNVKEVNLKNLFLIDSNLYPVENVIYCMPNSKINIETKKAIQDYSHIIQFKTKIQLDVLILTYNMQNQNFSIDNIAGDQLLNIYKNIVNNVDEIVNIRNKYHDDIDNITSIFNAKIKSIIAKGVEKNQNILPKKASAITKKFDDNSIKKKKLTDFINKTLFDDQQQKEQQIEDAKKNKNPNENFLRRLEKERIEKENQQQQQQQQKKIDDDIADKFNNISFEDDEDEKKDDDEYFSKLI